MKKMGLIGGLGPEATVEYYRIITRYYLDMSGGKSYPYVIIYSMDVKELLGMAESEEWDRIASWLTEGIKVVHKAGAEFALISAGTPHIVFDKLRAVSPIPLLSIVEETLKAVEGIGLRRVGLFGTRFTMQSSLFQREFSEVGIDVLVPDEDEQDYIHNKLEEEIALGTILDRTRQGLLSIVEGMIESMGIEGLILGCTELPLILDRDEFGIPFLNTTKIHAESAVRYCLAVE